MPRGIVNVERGVLVPAVVGVREVPGRAAPPGTYAVARRWRWSLRRLWVMQASRHSVWAAGLPWR